VTHVHIEQATLSDGSALVYKDYGNRVRMAYDPSRITEKQATDLLRHFIPRLSYTHRVSQHAGV
jgi:hypothetical protein